jgi:hypothetical protein
MTHADARLRRIARQLEGIAQRVRLLPFRDKRSHKPLTSSDIAIKAELIRLSKYIEAEAKRLEQSAPK